MNVTVPRHQLQAAFGVALAAVPTRSSKPILANLMLDVGPRGARLSASDLEVSVEVSMPSVVSPQETKLLLPAATFAAILRETMGDEIAIALQEDQLMQVTAGQGGFTLPTAPAAEFPSIPQVDDEGGHCRLAGKALVHASRFSSFAADGANHRYALGGTLLETKNTNVLLAVATDGRRMAAAKADAAVEGSSVNLIVPERAMKLMERIVAEAADEEVLLRYDARRIQFVTPRATLTASLLEGRFPKWRDVIPQRCDATKVEIPAGLLLRTLKQAAIAADQTNQGVVWRFDNGTLTLSCQGASSSRVQLPVHFQQEPVSCLLNHAYVTDWLRHVPCEETVGVEMDGEEGAVLFSWATSRYVVMPLALAG